MDETIERARGRDRPFCAFDRPQDEYFVSSLASKAEAEEGEFTESTPNNIGLKFKTTGSDGMVRIDIEFEVYVPSFPTREEYETITTTDEALDTREFTLETAFFRRVTVEYSGSLNLTDLELEAERITEELHDELDACLEDHLDSHILRRERGLSEVEDVELPDEDEFETIRERYAACDNPIPSWELEFDTRRRGDEIRLSLANLSAEDPSRETDPYVFNPQISVEGEFEPYEFNLIPEDFRYNRDIWGKGQNCAVDTDADNLDAAPDRIWTTAIPSVQTHRFKQNAEFDAATSLDRLSDPGEIFEALEAIEEGMVSYLGRWRGPLAREKEQELTEEEFEMFRESWEAFEDEIEYFRHGIQVLDEVGDALEAFALMNESFSRQDGDMENWFLFQIVFIVSNLGSIVSREHPGMASEKDESAEVLWFPTGGGKTEAYLGLIVFSLFFDRLRGKERGVTAWIRFPLRLLGKQQKDRFIGIMNIADNVRREELDGAGEPFSLGFFVGSHDTPNSIHHDGRNNYWRNFQEDEDLLRRRCQVVNQCPECGAAVDVRFDPDVNTVYHECTDEDCPLGTLDLYVTDHDVYRNVPSVLLGTLDKISITGANPRFANLLGNFTHRCPVHGLGYAGKCPEGSTLDCDEELERVTDELYDPIPSLHLIDEVHLLNEELGVFAGQYETLYQELCRQQGDGDEPKVITSTATIAEYEKQLGNLFVKDANRFPEEGPNLKESFYGRIDETDPERRYLGITPVNKTHIYAVLDLVKKYHQVIRDYRSKEAEEFGLTKDQYHEVLDMYELSVVYFLRKTEKDTFLRSIENQINREMERDGYEPPLRTEQLTADIETTAVLDELSNPSEPFEDRVDTVGATSFIGHGIDVDRFNTMFFFGFPSETFQYIQSSARVGRKHLGNVVDVFRPYDARDRHRFKYFAKSHEYLRRSIESVSIDRWSKYSLEKTFPGIFKALLIQHYRPLMDKRYGINVQSSRDLQNVLDQPEDYPEFNRESYRDLLLRSYGLHREDNEYFERRISQKTESYWEYWMKQLGRQHYTTFMEEGMRSLRDIGEQVDISIESTERGTYRSLTGGD